MLLVLHQDILVARVRNVRVNIEFVVANVRFEEVAEVAALIILFQRLRIHLVLSLRFYSCVLLFYQV